MNISFAKLNTLNETGIAVFGSEDAFTKWMDSPAHGLDNQVPVTFLTNDEGIDTVIAELNRIAHGDLS